MLKATKILGIYLATIAVLITPKACSATDNQSDNGSQVTVLSGTGEHVFPPGSPFYGTYKAHASGKNRGAVKANCKWKILVPMPNKPNKYFQVSPKAAGQWNHLNSFGRGSAKITPVTDPKYIKQPRVLLTDGCPKWELRK